MDALTFPSNRTSNNIFLPPLYFSLSLEGGPPSGPPPKERGRGRPYGWQMKNLGIRNRTGYSILLCNLAAKDIKNSPFWAAIFMYYIALWEGKRFIFSSSFSRRSSADGCRYTCFCIRRSRCPKRWAMVI